MVPPNLAAFLPPAIIGWATIGAVLGAIIGSFVAALVLRWPAERSVMTGRSRCDACGVTLRARDLVPILSHVALRGRCARCGAAIDRHHLVIELACAAIGAIACLAAPGPAGLAGAALGWCLLALAVLDYEHFWLPDRLTLPLAAAGLIAVLAAPMPSLADRAIGVAAGYGALSLLAIGYKAARGRDGLGAGDPKLLGAIGAWLGWRALPATILAASLIGLAWALARHLRRRDVTAQTELPFGTLLALAAWPVWLASN